MPLTINISKGTPMSLAKKLDLENKINKKLKNYEYYKFILEKRLFSFSTCWISIFGGLKKRGVKRASFSTVFTPHLK